MRVVKQKSGYRITCSDSEFEVLDFMVHHGSADLEDQAQLATLTPAAKRAYRTDRFQQINGPLSIDDDRRAVEAQE